MGEKKKKKSPEDETTQIYKMTGLFKNALSGEKSPSLVIIDGNEKGRIIYLTNNYMTIGRGSHADIIISDKTVSRKHCLIEVNETDVVVIDLESSNGTYVNNVKINKAHLNPGDKIRIGSTLLKFELTDKEDSEFLEDLYKKSTFDDLTSLYNRNVLMEKLEGFFGDSGNAPLSILFLDLDHFKKINDEFGHQTGSDVLSEVGRLLLSNTRTADIAGRYGGEEFVIILPHTTESQASYVAEKIRKIISNHKFKSKDGKDISITVSIGVAQKTDKIYTPEELIKISDEAMYFAKKMGRNRTVLYKSDVGKFITVTPEILEDKTPPFGFNVDETSHE